ncbi:NAD(P)H-hydrate epimerase [Sporobacter termitidis DSM 10068]|uniref:Bifunctional NAD(P)H-hydrate repair enzyme n=1 Tax=Sporobacter termitidis DSM 10068 TaxID=1123282 RepID=A0A1M5WDY1_9FIRM|nr:bifunctional ADP-dependent NAD(P)H-hydrate dehydratase/NAD(P)H-hydrate epimerase [Sporobacter termitidis]SHH85779.1 NAD(P)H-hydrate epimerase [Sporobacter termitidis DSM 10068]
MKLLNAAQMRALDRYAIDILGVPSTLLMTNAARQVAEAALELISEPGPAAGKCAAVFCGPGNNGGDGVAAASYLLKKGVKVRVFLTGNRDKMTADTAEMERRLNEDGAVLEDYAGAADVEYYVNHCGVIVDALFGIGLNTALRGDALDAVRLINGASAPVVAADIPSGVEADTGNILGEAVGADVTVTFSLPKPGQFVEPGCTCCGSVRIADIGIPAELLDKAEADCRAVTAGEITLPRRRPDTHKGDYGRDLIIAGSVGFTGAPVLAARAASAAGAGLVSLGVPETIYNIAAVKCDEEMPFPLPCTAEGSLGGLAVYPILDRLKKADVCLVGPGLGRSQAAREIVFAILKEAAVPVVLDADGINAVSGNIDILDEALAPVILTPHAGEFKRLGGNAEGGARLSEARRFAVSHGCILVLKGHRTITALPDGAVCVNTTGGPAMAKGGTGDVLAGMIAALVGQKFPLKDAVLAAVYLHGLAGDLCQARYGEYSVTAGRIIDMLPEAIKTVISSA